MSLRENAQVLDTEGARWVFDQLGGGAASSIAFLENMTCGAAVSVLQAVVL